MLHRFIHPGPFLPGAPLVLEGEEGHHAARAVRVRSGEHVELFDGRGRSARAIVVEVEKSSVKVAVDELLDVDRELPYRLTLAAAIIHPDKYELILQKGTELGVTRFLPLLSERVDTRIERIAGKRERWERIIVEATKQSGRSVIPSLSAAAPLASTSFDSDLVLFFDADQPHASLASDARRDVTLLVGPEGGWSDSEIARAADAGWATRRLGPRRLRAETAAITAIVTTLAALGGLD